MEADFKELLLSGSNSDVIIEVKHKKFNCHRCILGARSPVFAAMLDHDMKEKTSGVLTIEDVEPDVFQEFLLYLYSGNDNLLSWKNFPELYKLADKYGVEDLKNVITNDIKENINKENFIEFFKLSRLPNDSKLSQVVIQFFVDKSIEIVRREDWMTCLSENPVECNVLIKALADYSQKKTDEISNAQQEIEALNAHYRDIE